MSCALEKCVFIWTKIVRDCGQVSPKIVLGTAASRGQLWKDYKGQDKYHQRLF